MRKEPSHVNTMGWLFIILLTRATVIQGIRKSEEMKAFA